jgi:hypothetical protein
LSASTHLPARSNTQLAARVNEKFAERGRQVCRVEVSKGVCKVKVKSRKVCKHKSAKSARTPPKRSWHAPPNSILNPSESAVSVTGRGSARNCRNGNSSLLVSAPQPMNSPSLAGRGSAGNCRNGNNSLPARTPQTQWSMRQGPRFTGHGNACSAKLKSRKVRKQKSAKSLRRKSQSACTAKIQKACKAEVEGFAKHKSRRVCNAKVDEFAKQRSTKLQRRSQRVCEATVNEFATQKSTSSQSQRSAIEERPLTRQAGEPDGDERYRQVPSTLERRVPDS